MHAATGTSHDEGGQRRPPSTVHALRRGTDKANIATWCQIFKVATGEEWALPQKRLLRAPGACAAWAEDRLRKLYRYGRACSGGCKRLSRATIVEDGEAVVRREMEEKRALGVACGRRG